MTGDRIAACIGVAIALTFGLHTGNMHYNGALFPRMVSCVLFVLSIVKLARIHGAGKPHGQRFGISRHDAVVLASTIVIVVVWVSLMNSVGFIVTSVVSMVLVTYLLDMKRVSFNNVVFTVAAYSAVVTLIWFVFQRVLLVPLPMGFLF